MNAVPAQGGSGGDRSGPDRSAGRALSRRRFLRAAGIGAAAVPLSSALAACGGGGGGGAGDREVRIGFVSPQTGLLSGYADVDSYTISAMQQVFKDGIRVGSQTHPVRIFSRDSQSDGGRAAEATSALIFKDKVDIVLAGGTSDTTNPVADQCEANQVPCISTAAPWESWFYGRGGQTDKPFTWTYHIFWGLDDLQRVYKNMWDEAQTNKKVGLLLPNDTDGNRFEATIKNFLASNDFQAPVAATAHYDDVVGDVGKYAVAMAEAGVEIVAGVPLPSDFNAFWLAATKQGSGKQTFLPKVVTVSKALVFQTDVRSLGSLPGNLSTEVWWSPEHPFKSSLTSQNAKQLAADYTTKNGKLWSQPLGFSHALFEVVAKALEDVPSIDDKAAIAKAIGNVKNLNTIVGPIAFGRGGAATRNVATTPLVGGQWKKASNSYELFVTSSDISIIPETKQFEVLSPVTT